MMSSAAAQSAGSSLDALTKLNDIVTRYCESQMLFTACNLGIFDQLSGGAATAAELGAQLKIDPDPLASLLLGLHQMELLTKDGDRFSNAPAASYLTANANVPLQPLTMWGSLFARH